MIYEPYLAWGSFSFLDSAFALSTLVSWFLTRHFSKELRNMSIDVLDLREK